MEKGGELPERMMVVSGSFRAMSARITSTKLHLSVDYFSIDFTNSPRRCLGGHSSTTLPNVERHRDAPLGRSNERRQHETPWLKLLLLVAVLAVLLENQTFAADVMLWYTDYCTCLLHMAHTSYSYYCILLLALDSAINFK